MLHEKVKEISKLHKTNDKIAGLVVYVSTIGVEGQDKVSTEAFNQSLIANGFDREEDKAIFFEDKKLSSVYLDVVREYAKKVPKISNHRGHLYTYNFDKTLHDVTKSGLIIHSLTRIAKEAGGVRLDNNRTMQVAQITFRALEGDASGEVEFQIFINEEIELLNKFVEEFRERRDRNKKDASDITKLVTDSLTSYFNGYKLRASGGVYFLPTKDFDSMSRFIKAVTDVCPQVDIGTIPVHSSDTDIGFTSIQASLKDEIHREFRALHADWKEKIEAAEAGGSSFRNNGLISAASEMKRLRERAEAVSRDLRIDLAQTDAINQAMLDLLNRGYRVLQAK